MTQKIDSISIVRGRDVDPSLCALSPVAVEDHQLDNTSGGGGDGGSEEQGKGAHC